MNDFKFILRVVRALPPPDGGGGFAVGKTGGLTAL